MGQGNFKSRIKGERGLSSEEKRLSKTWTTNINEVYQWTFQAELTHIMLAALEEDLRGIIDI